MTWAEPDSGSTIINNKHQIADFKEDRTKNLIKIGQNTAEFSGDKAWLHLSSFDIKADLSIHSWMPGFKIGDGKTFIKKEKYYQLFIEIPRGSFNG